MGWKNSRMKIDFVDTKNEYKRDDLKYYLKRNPLILAESHNIASLSREITSSIMNAIDQYNKANNTVLQDDISLIALFNNIIDNDLVISNTKDKLDIHYEEIALNMVSSEQHLAGGNRLGNLAYDIVEQKMENIVLEALLAEGTQKYKDVTNMLRFFYSNKDRFYGKDESHVIPMLENEGFSDNYLFKHYIRELANYKKLRES